MYFRWDRVKVEEARQKINAVTELEILPFREGGVDAKQGKNGPQYMAETQMIWWMEWNEKMLILKECNVVAMGTDLDHWFNNRSCLSWGTL